MVGRGVLSPQPLKSQPGCRVTFWRPRRICARAHQALRQWLGSKEKVPSTAPSTIRGASWCVSGIDHVWRLASVGEVYFSLSITHSSFLFPFRVSPLWMSCEIKLGVLIRIFWLNTLKIESRSHVAVLMEWFSTESYNISKNMNVLCKYGFFTSKIKCTVLFSFWIQQRVAVLCLGSFLLETIMERN